MFVYCDHAHGYWVNCALPDREAEINTVDCSARPSFRVTFVSQADFAWLRRFLVIVSKYCDEEGSTTNVSELSGKFI